MSDHRLNTHVHAVELDDKGALTGRSQVFGPDDDLSTENNRWALAAITNPHVWVDGKAPENKPAPPEHEDDEVARLRARVAELEAEKSAAGTDGDKAADDEDPATPKDDEPSAPKSAEKPAPRPRSSGKPTQ